MDAPNPESAPTRHEPTGYELVEEPAPRAPAASADAGTCMGCGALMRAGAVLCARCGYDSRAGVRASTSAGGAGLVKKCAGCGYELTGLKRPVCPECGASFSAKDRRRLDRDHSEGVARAEWIKPLVMLGIGWGIVLMHALVTGGLGGAGTYLTQFAIALPVGIAAYLVCCVGGLGFDAPLPLMAWRLLGAFALIDAAVLACGSLPSPYLVWGVPAIVAVAIFERIFDLDWPEAFAAGIITYAARKVTILAITGQLAALF
jgi:hypothetical protein